MEFYEKLQELRKSRGLTQEELAARLYVSRTAVSKWESGRGYPGIESLKAIASFFSVTVDDLLSTEAVLSIAQEEKRQTEEYLRDLIYGLLDLCMALLLFLPFFARDGEGVVHGVSLLALDGVRAYLKILYLILVIGTALTGILTLALQACEVPLWTRIKGNLSLTLGGLAVLLFTVGLHPYAAVFSFALLSVKALVLIKRM